MSQSPLNGISERVVISPFKSSAKTKHISPDEVLQGFFYDDSVLRNLDKNGLDIAKGHLQLLTATEVYILNVLYIFLNCKLINICLG